MTQTGTDISLAAELLTQGEIIAIPTETVYGLAANAFDENAILKVFQIKKRPFFDPLILHIAKIDDLFNYAISVPDVMIKLIEKYWPGPLSIVVRKKSIIPDIMTSGLPTVAIRMPNHPLTLELLNKIPFPLAAPSANLFGKISPTSVIHVKKQLAHSIKYILDGGKTKIGIESTILKHEEGRLIILRRGAITADQIAETTGIYPESANESHGVEASGQMKSHYATHTPLKIIDFSKDIEYYRNKSVCLLKFNKIQEDFPAGHQRILSLSSDLNEAARNFFNYLHELDEMNMEFILAEYVPDQGIGYAINDRLNKAAAAFNE